MITAIKNYFAITKKQWNGMIVLAVIVLVILIAPGIYQLCSKPEMVDFSRIKAAYQILSEAKTDRPDYNYNAYNNDNKGNASFSKVKSKAAYFRFNPNNLAADAWKKLGLSERQIWVIKNYEAKGGKFYKKDDLQKIYSITSEEYAALAPYIDIPEKRFDNHYPEKSSMYKTNTPVIVEINHADSAQLTTIKGIGPAFANRILKYRNRLGGFYRKTQLLEVYGLDSSKYEEIEKQIEVDNISINRININTCSFEELKRNPYLTYKQMNAIIQYRKQHGNFSKPADLKNVAILNDEVIGKIEPYLSF